MNREQGLSAAMRALMECMDSAQAALPDDDLYVVMLDRAAKWAQIVLALKAVNR